MSMNKYALFQGDNYYPNGGADDFKCFGATLDELKAEATHGPDKWAQIVEVSTMKTLCWFSSRTKGKWETRHWRELP